VYITPLDAPIGEDWLSATIPSIAARLQRIAPAYDVRACDTEEASGEAGLKRSQAELRSSRTEELRS
jgi:hypothetical protein